VARTPQESLGFYEQAVAAGERALGPAAFAEDAGDFWGLRETRPYLRARLGLANCLVALDRREEAVGHAQDLLRLNAGDNQGVRDLLLGQLLALGRDDAAEELLKQSADDWSAAWLYGRALVKFRRLGDGVFARRALADATAANPFVPAYLLGTKRLPKRPSALIGIGDDAEAAWYAGEEAGGWHGTPGALDWLRRTMAEAGTDGTETPRNDAARRTGPRFALNPYEEPGFTRCPECDRPTKRRHYHVAVLIEPGHLLAERVPGRLCEADELLVVKQIDLEDRMAADLAGFSPELIGSEYVPIGLIDHANLRGVDQDTFDAEWAIAHIHGFRELVDLEDEIFSWLDDDPEDVEADGAHELVLTRRAEKPHG